MTIVLENAQTQKNEAGQYLIDRLRLDDPSLKAMNNLDVVFDVLLETDEIDDVRTDKDFKWGMFLFKEILDAMREARVTNRYNHLEDTTEKLVNELLCESSNYRAMLAIYNAVTRLDFSKFESDRDDVLWFLKTITDVQSKFPYPAL